MERSLHEGARANAVDALFSRISESAVSANERVSEAGRRKAEERKKELLKGWAIATGNWHTDLSEFTNEAEPFDEGKVMSMNGFSPMRVLSVGEGSNLCCDHLRHFLPTFPSTAGR